MKRFVFFDGLKQLRRCFSLLEMFPTHTLSEVLEELSICYKMDQNDLLESLEQLLNQWSNKKI